MIRYPKRKKCWTICKQWRGWVSPDKSGWNSYKAQSEQKTRLLIQYFPISVQRPYVYLGIALCYMILKLTTKFDEVNICFVVYLTETDN